MWYGSPGDGPQTSARIDLEQDAQGGWHAVVTFDEKAPGAFVVSDEPTRLVLEGAAAGQSSPLTSEHSLGEIWRRFELAKTSESGVGAVVRGLGDFAAYDGGDAYCEPLSGPWSEQKATLRAEGTLGADDTAPEATLQTMLRPGRKGAVLLPWDTVRVLLSEPVDPSALLAALSVTTTKDDTTTDLAVAWKPPPGASPEAAWAGAQELRSEGPWPTGSQLRLRLAAGAQDRAGNALVADQEVELPEVVDAGEPVASLELDEAPPGLWGSAKHLAGGEGSECELGGCVDLGAGHDYCPLPLAGLAARLSVPEGATSINVRYRLFSSENWPGGISVAASLELHGDTSHDTQPLIPGPVPDEPLEDLGPEAGKLRYRSSWRTKTVPLPVPVAAGVLDVALYKGANALAPDCIFSPFEWQESRLLIERVWVE